MEEIDSDKSLTRKEKQEARNAVGNGGNYEVWKEENKRALVDLKRIESKTCTRIYKNILGEKDIADTVVTDARRMLKHRSGSVYEDLYVYDLTTGKQIDSVTNHNERQTVRPTEKLKDKMKKAKADNHVLFELHNHPHSGIPSFSDIDGLTKSGNSFGLIACHDGNVYKYSIVGKPMPGYTLDDERLRDSYYRRLISGKSEDKIFKAMEMELGGVRIEHFD